MIAQLITTFALAKYIVSIDSEIHLLSKSEVSSLLLSSWAIQPGLCRTWSQTPKIVFFRLVSNIMNIKKQPFKEVNV